MTPSPAIESLTLTQAAALLAAGECSSMELVDAVLGRIQMTEGVLHAFATVDAEAVRGQARLADETRASGPLLGPLHGLPIAIKDVIDTRDLATECGSRLLRGRVPNADATVVARLRRGGAVILGKTVTKEFATGTSLPKTKNPWDPECFPGGSSAGSGAAVAAGSALAALGSDSGGSIRQPSSLCGVVGLKPTYGRVSRHGVFPQGSSMDQVGPMTRTVADCGMLLGAIAGHDPLDPTSSAEPVPDYTSAPEEPVGAIRLGVIQAGKDPNCDPDVAAGVSGALDELAVLGMTLVPIEMPAPEVAIPAAYTILMADQAAAHHNWMTTRSPSDYEEGTWRFLVASSLLPAMHLQAAHRVRRAIAAEVARMFRDASLDAIAIPTLPTTAMPLADLGARSYDTTQFARYTVTANLTGLPALSVPCGFSPRGLPIGLQLVGRPFGEIDLLRIGHLYETATDWHTRHPSLGS